MTPVIQVDTIDVITNDPVSVMADIKDRDVKALTPNTAYALSFLDQNPDIDWVKVASIKDPTGHLYRLVVSPLEIKLLEDMKRLGIDMHHGDVYITDELLVQDVDSKALGEDEATGEYQIKIGNGISVQTQGMKAEITREDLEHPQAKIYLSLSYE